MISDLLDRLFGTARQLKQANERLRREVAAHETTLRELEAAHGDLERRVAERTAELSLVSARFETALRAAKVYVFSQDRDLRYTWVYSPHGGNAGVAMLGRSDPEILPQLVAMKHRVLETGAPEEGEVSYVMPEGRALFALHVDPIRGQDGAIDGLMCAAVDISRLRSLETEQRRLTEELGTAAQRYETALRGSHVTVYTQDRDLRYTSISNPMLGRKIEDILGRTDAEILPAESREPIIALKRKALETGQPQDSEASIAERSGLRWYDFHIEPLRDVMGSTVGLVCAVIDITERKENEAHLRMLMRELTHRSKNLLAVIQAMARQTARHAGSIEGFLDQFSARLQALATSHDLLVQEGWHGASLYELVRSHVAQYLDGATPQVSLDGPGITLKPEITQSLGLALHELVANAVAHGALSVPAGHVSITWQRLPPPQQMVVEMVWSETGGPQVTPPEHRGFGRLVIERNLARSLDSEVDLAFAPEGVRCRVVIPASHLSGP